MPRKRPAVYSLFFVALTVATAAVVANGLVSAQARRPVTDAQFVQGTQDEWLIHAGDYSETRFSRLTEINASNVQRLGLEWSFDLGQVGAVRGNPLVANGVLYGSFGNSILFAVDARTGAMKWRWDPKIPLTPFEVDDNGNRVMGTDGSPIRIGPIVCCVRTNRGVAVYRGKVYAGLLDGRLVALDAETGKLIWEVRAADYTSDYSITMAPRIIKGKVIVGNSGADMGVRGYVDAYDADTGHRVWRFYTVPGDPSKPFEGAAMKLAAGTWRGEWWKVGGGGTVWNGVSYDPGLDLLYLGVGNGGPWVQDYRSPGGGDNLFLASIVAVRPDTGEYVWHFQTTPGDMWDFGANSGMTLAELRVNGRTRKVLLQANKNGFFYVLDRETGHLISAQPFAKVTWATGVDQRTGRSIEAPNARYGVDPVVLSPRAAGAHREGMSFNPELGLAYIPAEDSSAIYRKDPQFVFQPGQRNQGNALPMSGPGVPAFVSFLSAWDPVKQEQRWRVDVATQGTLSTASKLVFSGDAVARRLRAYDGQTGRELWASDQVPLVDFSNPITYMIGGKQYVAVMTRSHLVAFALDGTAAMPPPPPR